MDTDQFIHDKLYERKKSIEKKLYYNIVVQCVAILIGISYMSGSNAALETVSKNINIDKNLLIYIVPLSLVYCFIEFGYALGHFFFLHKNIQLVNQPIIEKFGKEKKLPVDELTLALESFNIFTQLSGNKRTPEGKFQTTLSRIVIMAVIWLNHFIAYQCLEEIISDITWLVFWKCTMAITFLFFYVSYFSSNKAMNYSPKLATIITAAPGIAIIFIFVLRHFSTTLNKFVFFIRDIFV